MVYNGNTIVFDRSALTFGGAFVYCRSDIIGGWLLVGPVW